MKKKLISMMFAVLAIASVEPAVAAITGISGSAGNQKSYYYDVPVGVSKLEIKISGGTGDCDLYVKYGSYPTTSSYNYRPYLPGNNETVTINNPASGRWCMMLNGFTTYSGVTLSCATLSAPSRVATPTFTPAAGTYSSAQSVSISCSTVGATIRYTTDGYSEPTATSTQYTGPISVSSSRTIKAKAFKASMTDSVTASAVYTINIPSRVATPTFSPAAGTYASAQSVSISCGTAGATIRYTTDGYSEPTTASTQYTAPISVASTKTIKAKAFKSGMTESYTALAAYTINIPQATTLANNIPVKTISDVSGGQRYYKISVPAGQTKLVIKIFGGSGDCDLYVKRGALPTTSSSDYCPWLGGNNETVDIPNPAAGEWYIMLRGYSAYSGVTLVGKVGNVYGIVLGCADYPTAVDLNECLDDGNNFYNYLVNRRGAASANIKLLKDTTSSSSDDIVSATVNSAVTVWLMSKATTSFDEVHVYYSGHGSPDGNICPHESWISPSSLKTWLASVKGNRVVTFDSCFAAGALNTVGDRMLAACRNDETSKVCTWGGQCLFTGLSGSVFTTFLLDEAGKQVNDADGNGTVEIWEAFTPAKARIEGWQGWVNGGVKMHPQLK